MTRDLFLDRTPLRSHASWLLTVLIAATLFGCEVKSDEAVASRDETGETETTTVSQGDKLTLSGVLIDSRCHSKDPSHIGNDHTIDGKLVKACATACAKQGFPAALLTDDRATPVWMLVTNAQVLADYMADEVRVAGTVRSNGVLIPDRVELKSGDDWIIVM